MVVTNLYLKEKGIKKMEFLKQVSSQLGTMRNVIETMTLGLITEGMEEQAVDCMECLETYVIGLKEKVDKHIQENN